MGREENCNVFKDTERLCKTDPVLKESVAGSVKAQRLIPETFELPEKNRNRYNEPARIVVSKKRTFEAAEGVKDLKTAVHNFASATNPGGGVTRGANAQEECLCRCSGLYFCLNIREMWEGFYAPHRAAHDPIHNDDIIYTPNVTVFKTDTSYPELMPRSEWYDVDVITCAAPNLRPVPGNSYNSGDAGKAVSISDSDLQVIHEKRLRRILDVALEADAEAVILGAFGCGAFMNDPHVVARAAKTVIEDYLYAFRYIEFAVYCSPRDDSNYRVFNSILV